MGVSGKLVIPGAIGANNVAFAVSWVELRSAVARGLYAAVDPLDIVEPLDLTAWVGAGSSIAPHRLFVALAVIALLAGCGSTSELASGTTMSTQSVPTDATTTVVPASSAAVVTVAATTSVMTTTTVAITAPPVMPARQPVPPSWLAVWDVCDPQSDVRIIDDTTGAPQTTLLLQGRPMWSHDRTRIAAVDDMSGALRVADVATGATA